MSTRFEKAYGKFSKPLIKFIAKRIGRDQDAVNEVFTNTVSAAWKGYKTFKHKSSYFTWICRIALNKIADYYRGQIHERSVIVAPFLEDIANIQDNHLSPEEEFALQDLRVSIRKLLNLLPSEKRRLLYLRYWKDLSIKQIAKIMNVNERVIEGKIYRAKRELKKMVSQDPSATGAYVKSRDF